MTEQFRTLVEVDAHRKRVWLSRRMNSRQPKSGPWFAALRVTEDSTMAAKKTSSPKQPKNEAKSAPAVSYDDFKQYEGQRYTGMKIGRNHKWHYDRGEWKEKKITP